MVIKKQPVISWLLEDSFLELNKIGIPATPYFNNRVYLSKGIERLGKIRASKPEWGLPELVMPSFEEAMTKSAKAFINMDHQLFEEFYNDGVCGILLTKDIGTIVYGFGENTLDVWVFRNYNECSILYLYFYAESTPDNRRKIFTIPTLASDPYLFNQPQQKTPSVYEILTNRIMIYLAVKKYVKVETKIIAPNSIAKIDDTVIPYKTNQKVRNDSGQEVIVMDSKWFRKIVNDNDIFVRGYFRLQNKKNSKGEWYKELIFIDSFIRHGYHRNAKIEDNIESQD